MFIIAFTEHEDGFHFSFDPDEEPSTITLFTTTPQEVQFIPDAEEQIDGSIDFGGARTLPNSPTAPPNCSIVCISRYGTYLIGEKTILRVRRDRKQQACIHLDKITVHCPAPTVHTLDPIVGPTTWERL